MTKFSRPMQNDTPMTKVRSKSKPEIEFQNGGHPLSEIGIVLSQQWIEISHRNLVCK